MELISGIASAPSPPLLSMRRTVRQRTYPEIKFATTIRGEPTAIETEMHRLAGDRWQTSQKPGPSAWWARTLVIWLRATGSYPNPTVYTPPADPFTRSGESSRLRLARARGAVVEQPREEAE